MTRGQIAVIIGDDEIITSTEFNGDMYMPTPKWAGHGQEVINRLKKVNDKASYEKEVKKFNEKNFKYPDNPLTHHYKGLEMLNMEEKTYFDKWFSDYVYMKNLTDKEQTIKDYKGNNFTIYPNQIAVINFGELKLMA